MSNKFQPGEEVFIVDPGKSGIAQTEYTEKFFEEGKKFTIKEIDSPQCYRLAEDDDWFWYEDSLAPAIKFEVDSTDLEALLGEKKDERK